jgi:hypothetical protein
MMREPKSIAWEMFQKTGNAAYYSLYKRLENGEEGRSER